HAVAVHRAVARLVARGHGAQRRDGAKLEGAGRRCMHACEAVARSCGAPDRTRRSASFDRAWRPQGQSSVDGITNKPRVARRGGVVNVEEGTNTRTRTLSDGGGNVKEKLVIDRCLQKIPPLS